MSQRSQKSRRFAIAVSYPGRPHRRFVRNVVKRLAKVLGEDRIFFDERYEAELAGIDGDLKLRRYYREQSEVVVPFFSQHYENDWCQIEWSAIRAMLKERRKEDAVIPIQLDDTKIEGWENIDFAIRRKRRTGREIADLIIDAYRHRNRKTDGRKTEKQLDDRSTEHRPVARRTQHNNLPFASIGPRFKGREAFLRTLRDSLCETHKSSPRVVLAHAIHGLGGVGKTRLAVEYAWRRHQDYSAALFVEVDVKSLNASLATLFRPLNLKQPKIINEETREFEEEECHDGKIDENNRTIPLSLEGPVRQRARKDGMRAHMVMDWLRNNGGWLLILDNVDDKDSAKAVNEFTESVFNPFIQSPGHILITGRWNTFGPSVRKFELNVLGEAVGVAYLIDETSERRRVTNSDERDARQLARRLDGLAVALEQAAAYIYRRRCSFADYLRELNENFALTVGWYDELRMQYSRSVAATWETTMKRLSDQAKKLLGILSWLATDPIPRKVAETSDHRDESINELADYSMLKWDQDSDTLLVHPLVKEISRERIAPPDRDAVIKQAMQALNKAARDQLSHAASLNALRPHAAAVVRYAAKSANSGPSNELSLLFSTIPLDLNSFCSFAFAPWRRERIGLPEEDWRLLHHVAFDLLRLDAAQLLKELGQPQVLTQLIDSDRIAPQLMSDALRAMSLHLNLLNYNRLAFQLACAASPVAGVRSYTNSATSPTPSTAKAANEICETYFEFLAKWVFGPIFLALFTLPYQTAIDLPASLHAAWSDFLKDLSRLAALVSDNCRPPFHFRLLNFWLSRVHQAARWPTRDHDRLRALCAECWQYDDPDSNRVHTYADYCGSSLAGQFIRQSAAELYFPTSGLKWPGSVDETQHIDWLDRQLYSRMATCVACAKGHPKGELLVRSCSDPDNLSHEDTITLLRFLRWYSATHFMGDLGELIGLPLVIRSVQSRLPPEATCIPGSSIRIRTDRGWQQGPDAVLANVRFDDGAVVVEILGLVEVKAYRRSARRLKEQIAKHRRRWTDGEVRLVAEEPSTTARWLPWTSLSADPSRREFTVTETTWADPMLEVGVRPASGRRSSGATSSGLLDVRMPWKPAGFQSMGLYFSLWLIENFGRVNAPDDYERGPAAWHSHLTRLSESTRPTKLIDRSTAKALLAVIEGRATNPDIHWARSRDTGHH